MRVNPGNQPALFDPLTLARVKDLPLVAKTLAQGFLHGAHHSIQKGTGVEFSQYRSYEPGDSLSKIDWKLFARSDKYFVREAQRESNINVWMVVDTSRSMLQGPEHLNIRAAGTHWNKLDYARILLATVSYLAHQQGDSLGLLALCAEKSHFLPPLGGARHWRKLLVQLSQLRAGSVFPKVETLQSQLAQLQQNALILVVSDFYQQNDEIIEFMRKLNPVKNDVVAIQLESNDEIEFPYKGQIRFEDLETQQQVILSAKDARQAYLSARAEFNQHLATQLKQAQIQHWQGNIDQPLDQMLQQFLTVRQRKR